MNYRKAILFLLIFKSLTAIGQGQNSVELTYHINRNTGDRIAFDYLFPYKNHSYSIGVSSLLEYESIGKDQLYRHRYFYSKNVFRSLGVRLGYHKVLLRKGAWNVQSSGTLTIAEYTQQEHPLYGKMWYYGQDFTLIEPMFSTRISRIMLCRMSVFIEGNLGVSIFYRKLDYPFQKSFSNPTRYTNYMEAPFLRGVSFGLSYNLKKE